MVSIDKVLLLQEKVESAVKVISQLKSENDALRTQCSELTNALSEKTKLLSSFQADEQKIEDGILKALDRLNAVENAVIKTVESESEQIVEKENIEKAIPKNEEILQESVDSVETKNVDTEVKTEDTLFQEPVQAPEIVNNQEQTPLTSQSETKPESETNIDSNGQFDIF